MPRKVKKSKDKNKKKRSTSKHGEVDSETQKVKMMVPLEQLSKKQLNMLKLADSL